jgi:excisionase family DNA binding protein
VDQDDANRVLAEALGAVVKEAVRDGVIKAMTELRAAGEPAMVSVPEAANRLGLGKTKVNELIASGDLPSVVVGKRRLLRPSDLQEFAARLGNAN